MKRGKKLEMEITQFQQWRLYCEDCIW